MAEQQAEQMQQACQGFDMAAHQRDREASLKYMKAMTPDGKMADAELHNEQLMRDAKQQGNQGNLVMVPPAATSTPPWHSQPRASLHTTCHSKPSHPSRHHGTTAARCRLPAA